MSAWSMSGYSGPAPDDARLLICVAVCDDAGAAVEGLDTDNFEVRCLLRATCSVSEEPLPLGPGDFVESQPGTYAFSVAPPERLSPAGVAAVVLKASVFSKSARVGTSAPTRAQRARIVVANSASHASAPQSKPVAFGK